jgi:hypothetical protein
LRRIIIDLAYLCIIASDDDRLPGQRLARDDLCLDLVRGRVLVTPLPAVCRIPRFNKDSGRYESVDAIVPPPWTGPARWRAREWHS